MKLAVTIDVEEDNWGQYGTECYGLLNISKIAKLQELFDRFEVKPTYLLTYPVATHDPSVALLKSILNDGRCEIGTHCHAWNTPPIVEEQNSFNSLLCNLPFALQYRKISELHQTIIKTFDIIPTSFRAGRWGFNRDTAEVLTRLGYKIDSSVIAFLNWKDIDGPDYSMFFPKPFLWDNPAGDVLKERTPLLEIPASGGFSQGRFQDCNRIWSFLDGRYCTIFHLKGILARLRLLNKVWLCPETSTSKQMIALAEGMIKEGYPILNMFFHSTSLMSELSPFVRTKEEERNFFRRIEKFLIYAQRRGFEHVRLCDLQIEDPELI